MASLAIGSLGVAFTIKFNAARIFAITFFCLLLISILGLSQLLIVFKVMKFFYHNIAPDRRFREESFSCFRTYIYLFEKLNLNLMA